MGVPKALSQKLNADQKSSANDRQIVIFSYLFRSNSVPLRLDVKIKQTIKINR